MSLTAEGVSVRFGGIAAIDDVTIELRRKEILGLIGPNGAGKTTLVNVLSGFQAPQSGTIGIDGMAARRWSRHRLVRLGVARTFQAVRLFRRLSVSENVEVGCVSLGLTRAAARREAQKVLTYLRLDDKAHLQAGALSYGDERRVGLARALALKPRFLLLDEPAAGLNPAELEELRRLILDIRASHGAGVLVIEHNMNLVMQLCERVVVLAGGRSLACGTPSHIRAHPEVRRAYLGSEAAA
ncbi:MAG: ABC transporter ATP-binding protein [Methylobacteriaceae bacterium]|nr:ABC transporter ATP-binding protein [Methylobacteriaceae bacterium]MBV9705673.1 ABC transporter ATP-binding protein [Methylobacteriaceae bacterium]